MDRQNLGSGKVIMVQTVMPQAAAKMTLADSLRAGGDAGDLLSAQQVADLLGVSRTAVRLYRQSGELQYVDLSLPGSKRGRAKFTREAVARFLERRTRGTMPARRKANRARLATKDYYA